MTTIIQTKDSDGSVIVYGNPVYPPTPTPGFTVREVETFPAGDGPLRWDNTTNALVRDPAPAQPVPALTARQLRLWLLSDGITPAAIDAQIAAISDPAAQARARVEWEYASEYKHDHPLVLQIGAALGLTQAQVDAGFRAAAAL